MRKLINPIDAPSPVGAYNQAVETEGMIFTSGQVGIDPLTGQLVEGGIENQTLQTLKNIETILHSVNLNKRSIVKLTVFVKNLNDFSSINISFENFFEEIEYPARSTVEVSDLPLGALIEIECIAVK